MSDRSYLESITEFGPLFEGADHVDVKTIEGNVDLRHFLAGLVFYTPGWLRFLYKVRSGLVRLFGLEQVSIEHAALSPEEIPFTPGEPLSFFTVSHGKENEYHAATARDEHLDGYILTAAEPLPDGRNRFHVGTIVYYNHWTGKLYFNIIRPFHHLVVRQMMKAGIKR